MSGFYHLYTCNDISSIQTTRLAERNRNKKRKKIAYTNLV